MSIKRRIERQKLKSANRLEKLTGGLPLPTNYTAMNTNQKQAQAKNLFGAQARYIAQEGRVGMLMTLTFPSDARIDLTKMSEEEIIRRAKIQYKSCVALIDKMRRSKRIKHDIRYIVTFELQSDGNIHAHIFLSVKEEDARGMIAFLFDFKKRYSKPYRYKDSIVYPIGRMHIGISARHKQLILSDYTFQTYTAKSDPSRTEHYIVSLESRAFTSGEWTPVEFYNEKMFVERYEEKIINYLTKTADGHYELEEEIIKEGVARNQIAHDTKTLFDDDYISKLQVRFIRIVGKRLYIHSRLPFPHKLYQKHFRALVEYDKNYTVYYNCITDYIEGKLLIDKDTIYNNLGQQIAPKPPKGGKNG